MTGLRQNLAIGALAMGMVCPAVWSQEGRSADSNVTEDTSALVAAGKAAVKALKPLAVGEKLESHFRAMFGPDETVGYISSRIEAVSEGGQTVYLYRADTVMTFPDRSKMTALIKAKLRPDFQPVEVELKRSLYKPHEDVVGDVVRITVGTKEVEIEISSGGQERANKAPRPDDPMIFGIELFVQRLDFEKHKEFIVHEFDVQSGRAGALKFTSDLWQDGTLTIITLNAAGGPSYQFWYDTENRLLRWGEPSMPILFVRTTRERAAQLKAEFAPK